MLDVPRSSGAARAAVAALLIAVLTGCAAPDVPVPTGVGSEDAGESESAGSCETTSSGNTVVCTSPDPGVVCLPLSDDFPLDEELVLGCAYKTTASDDVHVVFALTDDPDIEPARAVLLAAGESVSGEGVSGPGGYQVGFLPKDGHQVIVTYGDESAGLYGSPEYYYIVNVTG
jgi:hypothetical protein